MSLSKVSLAAVAGLIMISGAQAADLIVADPAIEMASANTWSTHLGVTGTVASDGTIYGGIGVVLGADVDLNDTVFLGGEIRGTAYFNGTGYLGAEGDLIGRIGVHATDSVDLYALGGVGYWNPAVGAGNPVYVVGVGAEFDVADDMAIRTELSGSGAFAGGITDVSATVGVLWKF
jgi:hypothetical protein